jgi:hypothetical protein
MEEVILNEALPFRPHEIIVPSWRGYLAAMAYLLPDWALSRITTSEARKGKQVQLQMSGRGGG